MHRQRLSQMYFEKAATTFHQSRKTTLQAMTTSLLSNAELTLTSLGRHMAGPAYVKNKIKRADRFLGNAYVYHELPLIYGEMLRPLLSSIKTLVIAVDWSGCGTSDYHVLRASLVYQGRSIPLYNKVVPEALQEDPAVHDAFLDDLKAHVLPAGAKVVVMTDGGFKTPWFDKVQSLGWEFVGRMRGRIHYRMVGEDWQDIKALQARAGKMPRYLGEGLLSKTSETQCAVHFFAVKQRPQGRHKSKPSHPEKQRRYRELHTEPWVIATSLDGGMGVARTIINLYKKRMQIEQNFRDDKNERWGFAWRYSRTRQVARISVLCLVATLATIILWLIGFTMEQQQWHRRFQANSVKHMRVLSYLFLAKQLLFHNPEWLRQYSLCHSMRVFVQCHQQGSELSCLR